MWDKQVDIH